MAKAGLRFIDNNNNAHQTSEEASKADIEILLGKLLTDSNSSVGGIASHVFKSRKEIEKIFSDYDNMNLEKNEAAKPIIEKEKP